MIVELSCPLVIALEAVPDCKDMELLSSVVVTLEDKSNGRRSEMALATASVACAPSSDV